MQNETLQGYRLSPQQRRLWGALGGPRAESACAQVTASVRGRLDVARLREALGRVSERHEALRTYLSRLAGMEWPLQVVAEAEEVLLPTLDLRGSAAVEREEELRAALGRDAEAGGWRVLLALTGEDEAVLAATTPALCCDARSLVNLLTEVWAEYGGEVVEEAVQYADYSEWQNELLEDEADEEAVEGRAFWRAQASGAGVARLPLEQARPRTDSAARPSWVELELEEGLASRVLELAQAQGLSEEVVLLGGWHLLLWRLTGQTEVAVETLFGGRKHEGLEGALGLFAKYLPVRARIDESYSFADVLRYVSESRAHADEWQDYFADEDADLAARLSERVGFEFQQWPAALGGAGLTLVPLDVTAAEEPFKVCLRVIRRGDSLRARLLFDEARLERDAAALMLSQFEALLEGVTSDPARAVGELEVLGRGERSGLLGQSGDNARPYPTSPLLPELIGRYQSAEPDREALVAEGASYTYAELDAAARAVARRLRESGVVRGDRVALLAARSARDVAGLLGCWRVGAAYVPLDPGQPEGRLAAMLEDCGARAVLGTEASLGALRDAGAGTARIPLDSLWSEAVSQPAHDGESEHDAPRVEAGDIAYLIYTSGTTGRPKGVAVTHGSLLNLLHALDESVYSRSPVSRVSVNAPLWFDASVKQLVQLGLGRSLLIVSEDVRTDAEALTEWVVTSGVEAFDCTPSHLRALLGAGLRSRCEEAGAPLRHLLIGGEAVDEALWAELGEWRGVTSHNLYGPTECTVDVTHRVIDSEGGGRPSLGLPLGNVEAYVLDGWARLCPSGVAGELCAGGAGIAVGYWGDARRTAERFVPDAYSGRPGARLYRTGDVARRGADGRLSYEGRADGQVKVRGFRIELGEVEAGLRGVGWVSEAAAAVVGEGDSARLVGYVVPHSTCEGADCGHDVAGVRERVKELLPDYMVPAQVVVLDSLPLTTNGKLDRRALPAPEELTASGRGEGSAPRTPHEEMLCELFSSVLSADSVGAEDNFFSLGGHSLLATQLVSRVREGFGVSLPLRSLFERPTPRQLAAEVQALARAGSAGGPPPLVRAERGAGAELPLSFAQRRLWFIDQLEPGSANYNCPAAVRLSGRLDVAALRRTLGEVVRRHEALRTRFVERDGSAVQVVGEACDVKLPVFDLSGLAEGQREAEARRVAAEQSRQGFDLQRGPLLRAAVVRLGAEEHTALLITHHIASDAWSVGVLVREVGALYAAYAGGEESPLPEPEVQYGDYAAWQREWLQGEALEEQLAYWRAKLAGAPAALELPTDRARPAVLSHRGAHHTFTLPKELTQELKLWSRREGATLYMTLLAAFKSLLYRYTGQEDIVVGTPVAGRNLVEIENLIGFFLNSLVLRTDLSGDPSFRELVGRVREVVLEAHEHQEVPFEKLVEELKVERSLSRSPLFQVSFMMNNTPQSELRAPGLSISFEETSTGAAKFDLTLRMMETERGINAVLEYNTELFDASTAERMAAHFRNLLEAAAADPTRAVSRLPVMAEAELEEILLSWNDTEASYPPRDFLHQLFEEQARRSPGAPAVVFEGESLTYGELDARAERLAGRLSRLGVGPDSAVAVCVERSPGMLVALLAVLKAGGAYVPLDVAYPQEQLAFILEDSGARVVITQQDLLEKLPPHEAPTVCVDSEQEESETAGFDAARGALSPDHVAYVIYTSGSTGRPKGVAVSHRAIVNRLLWGQEVYGLLESDGVMQVASFCFDFSVWEIFAPLLAGARLILPRPREQGDSAYLARLIAREKATIIHFVPTMLRAFLDEPGLASCESLRLVFSGGEALTGDLQRIFFERLPHAELYNQYGPTEATVDVTYRRCEPSHVRPSVPIGRPIANTRAYVVDERMSPCPVGVPGELYVGGECLARGYLRRPALTAAAFVPDPFSAEPGARLYRTGDSVRFLPDGEIEFLGRLDRQVKVRGFRIEAGEVESALLEHEALASAIVVVREDTPGAARLVAYVVARPGVEAPPGSELRTHLAARLPEQMLPSAYVALAELPMLPNGKLDRRALPAPGEIARVASAHDDEPHTPAEETLCTIWREVLGLERVGCLENFFELGGDSILSIQIVARANRAGLQLTPRQLFEHQTVRALAAAAGVGQTAEAEQGAVTGEVELTPIQARFFEVVEVAPHHFNQSLLLEARRPLDAEALRVAVGGLLSHHDALRLRFTRDEDGRWRQRNEAAEETAAVLSVVDLSASSTDELSAHIESEAARAQQSLDLSAGPLMRVVLFECGEQSKQRLLLVVHHLSVDGVSWRILLEDLQRAYEAAAESRPVELGAKGTSWKEWAGRLREWARGAEAGSEADYWLAETGGARAALPRDSEDGENLFGDAEVVTAWLNEDETRALLTEVPSVYRTQVNDALLSALAETLCPWAGGRVLVELEGHGREELFEGVDVSRTVGWFTARYPVALESAAGDSPGDLLKRVKEKLRGVPRKGVGYGALKYLRDDETGQQLRGRADGEVSFNYLGQFDGVLREGGLLGAARESAGSNRDARQRRAQLLDVNGGVMNGRLQLNWRYSPSAHARATVERLAGEYVESLRRLVEHARAGAADEVVYTAGDFELARLGDAELRSLVGTRRDVEDAYPLSPMQQGMLFFSLYAPSSGMYAEQMSCKLHGDLDVAAFEQAWRTVIERHAVLRTGFVWESLDEPLQVVQRHVELPLERQDLRGLSESEQAERLARMLEEDRYRGFDVSRAPLMRLKLVRLSEDVHHFVWNHHHLLLDGWSAAAVRKEVFSLYEAACEGVSLQLPAPRPYRDYIAWLRQQDMDEAEAFWRRTLKGFGAPTTLEMDRDPGNVAAPEDERGHARLRLSKEMTARLLSFAQQQQVTTNTLVLGVWALLLGRYSGRDDVVLGAAVSGRPPTLNGVEQMVGLFMNALPVRARVRREEAVAAWLKRFQQEQLDLRQYEYSPLAQVQRWSEAPRGASLFETIFVFDNYPFESLAGEREPRLQVRDYVSFEKTNYPLTVVVAPAEELVIRISYYRTRFDAADVARMHAHLEAVLTLLARAGQDATVADLLAEVEEVERRQRADRQKAVEEASAQKLGRVRRKAIVNPSAGVAAEDARRAASAESAGD